MKLIELIHGPSIVPEVEATDRNGVIRELMQSLAENGVFSEEAVEPIARAVIARENQGSTGFGKGVAVPHVKHELVTRMVATIGRSGRGIEFAALDRAPVFTVVLLLSPADKPDDHLAAMERIFRYLQRESFRKFLRQAESKDAIIDLIKEADEPQTS